MSSFEPLLSDSQAAELLHIHPKTLQRLARRGEIPAIRIGRYYRYRASQLNDWILNKQQSLVARDKPPPPTTNRVSPRKEQSTHA
jgi:excisionase family DNA binding protein